MSNRNEISTGEPQDWQKLTDMTKNTDFVVERVRLKESNIAIEGTFELPPLTQLTTEDQLFIIAFVRSHGSIKRMEEIFGISYPTVKNRLNHIGSKLKFIEVEIGVNSGGTSQNAGKVLEDLDRGEIDVEEALRRMKG